MLYNNLIFFLGLYSWNIKPENILDKIISKKNLSYTPSPPINDNKKFLEFTENVGTRTPNINLYLDLTIDIECINKKKIYLYNLYSLLVFLYLCIQPIYLLICVIYSINEPENNTIEYSITFLININTPLHYLWAKNYFSTNHMDLFTEKCELINCKYTNNFIYTILMILLVILNIILNLINVDYFYNKYYWINYFENKYIGCSCVIIEWIYSRFIYTITTISFTVVFCKHINEIKAFIKEIGNCDYNLEDSYCLSSLISKIASMRHSVEISIDFFNNIYSILTVTGGISFGILIRHKYNNRYLLDHEIFLIQSYIFIFLCQIIFFYNVIYYSIKRNELIKFIQSSSFINKFLTRWSTSKLKQKCKNNSNDYLTKIILCISEENATTLDWIILDKLLKTKWMDFSIMGISTQDGSLIKKVLAFSGIAIMVLDYF